MTERQRGAEGERSGWGRPSGGVLVAWLTVVLVVGMVCAVNANGKARWMDFRAFYSAGRIVRTTPSRLYDAGLQRAVQDAWAGERRNPLPFYHPAVEALLYAPFTGMRYGAAYVVFALFNLGMLGTVVWFLPRAAGWERLSAALLVMTFWPVLLAILQGQDSVLELLLCCWSLRRMEAGDEAGAGALVGAMMFRPQIALPMALLLGVRGTRRFAAGFVGVSAVMAAVSLALVGKSGLADLGRMLLRVTLAQDHSRAAQIALGVEPASMPNVRGLLAVCGGQYLPAMWAAGLTVAASLAVLAVGWRVMRRMDGVEGRFGVAVVCGVLVSYHLNSHDAALLLLPMLLLAGPGQRVLVALGWVLPYVLYAVSGARYFAWMGLVPLAMLWSARRERTCAEGVGELVGEV